MAPPTPIDPLLDALLRLDIDCDLEEHTRIGWHTFSSKFYERANLAADQDDPFISQAARLIGHCVSLDLVPHDRQHPFRVAAQFSNHRTASISDISIQEAESLAKFWTEVRNLEIRARLSDVAWEIVRDYKSGLGAAQSYLDISIVLLTDDWIDARDFIERGLRVAFTLGKGAIDQQEALKNLVLESIRQEHHEQSLDPKASRLLGLCKEFGLGDASELAELAESFADRTGKGTGILLEISRDYLELASGFWHRASNTERSRSVRLAADAMWIQIGDDYLREGRGYLSAVHQYERAYLELRQHQADSALVKHAREKMEKAQQLAQVEMAEFRQTIDLSESIQHTERMLSGHSFLEAILRFVAHAPRLNISQINELVAEQDNTLLRLLVGETVIVDGEGRPVARVSSTSEADIARYEFNRIANMYRSVFVHGWIDTGRRVILREHRVTEQSLSELLKGVPFVPDSRIQIFARGLVAGFFADFLVASHLLVPQLESSLRSILESIEIPTTRIDSDGDSKVLTLVDLLSDDHIKDLLGTDLSEDLSGLLIDQLGDNYRNRLAHGLMNENEFYSDTSCYVWFMVLMLCLWPRAVERFGFAGEQQSPSEEDDQ